MLEFFRCGYCSQAAFWISIESIRSAFSSRTVCFTFHYCQIPIHSSISVVHSTSLYGHCASFGAERLRAFLYSSSLGHCTYTGFIVGNSFEDEGPDAGCWWEMEGTEVQACYPDLQTGSTYMPMAALGLQTGTTCASGLTMSIFSEGYKRVAGRMNAMDLRRGINIAVDALLAHLKTRAKIISTTEGILPGEGIALLEKIQTPNFDQKVGVQTIQNALKMPAYTTAHYSVVEGAVVVSKLLEQQILEIGYDATKGGYVDMVKADITDPANVIRTALTDAASASSLSTTSEAVMTELPKNDAPAFPPGLKLIAEGRLQSRARRGTRDWSQGNGCRHIHSAGTSSEAIAVLKDHLQRGTTTDSYTYVKILQMCSKQKDLLAAKQVHDCIIENGMNKNPYVANALLNVYIKCGELLDVRRAFDELEKRDVVTWNMMIGEYSKKGDAKSALKLFNRMRQEGVRPNQVTYLSILKACASPLALKWGKEIHVYLQHAGFESDVRVGTALLQMYAKSGSIDDAQRVFHRMEKRSVVTWNIMIGGLAQHGCGHEAYRLFRQMRQEGFEPDAITYLSILNASASAGALEWVQEVHCYASKAGLESDLRVGNALVHMYAKSGSIDDAQRVFDRMEKRDVVTWNTMIGGLAQRGCGHEAYRLFLQMRREGFKPDARTFVNILSASASAGALKWVKDIHGYARKAELDSDLRVGAALVHMYAKSGSIDDARVAFDRMEKRNVVTWNVMIGGLAQHGCGPEAYRLFVQMGQEGFEPDAITFASLLSASASALALEWVKDIHGYACKAGLDSDLRVGTALIHMYAESGSIDDARRVFDRMEKRNLVTWNVMIGGLAQHGCGQEAYRLFRQMKREGFEPNAITYVSILNASASEGALEWVKEVHGYASEARLDSDLRVGTALIHMYAESGSIDEARRVFDRLKERNVVTWNAMIGGLAQHGCGQEAYQLFLRMRREGLEPNEITYVSILNASASAGALEWVKEVHGHASKAGLASDLRVGNALVHMYAESGSIDDARRVFDRMEKLDVVTWTIMIGGLAKHGCGHEAYRLFCQMRREGFKPNAFTYLSILKASASAGALEWVKEVHGHASKDGLESDMRVSNSLVHMYAKSGSIDDARRVFDRTERRDVVTWNAMIGGLALHGCGHEALALFRKMNTDLAKPDGTTFVALLSACCHGGLVDDGRRLFSAMTQDYGIEPVIVHYNCMVDLLGRAGHLEEAKLFISDMPIEPNAVTWKAFLGACRTYGNVKLGELAAKEVLNLEPNEAAGYVLLSNIYAAAGEWEKKELVRTMMQKRGVRKEPGYSWIEVENKIHEFGAGDVSHPEAKAIYTELQKLTDKLKAEGYIPDTRLVLHDINQEDKELALCSHSEKLAIAYGLIYIPRGEPIRVTKNLRVCPDCHTATKLISKVTGREIIARDANRFHHFKDGVCSCGDYW